ncbi:hypothetical protein BU17DRAFT_47936 [Hysterangium stoloniferum]|nr:hypothetical protein BU17DRAFT_47936 [Hysterangium stoloniferum]
MPEFSVISSVYRSLLREARRLPHLYVRQFFHVTIQQYFRENVVGRRCNLTLVNAKLSRAKKELRRLRRANNGEKKAMEHVLDVAYGRKGKLKHELMKRFLTNPFDPPPPRIIPGVERSRPPSYSPELSTLLVSAHARTITKPLKPVALVTPPTLPERADPKSEEARLLGTLSRRREVNIRWRYYVAEVKKTYYPLELTKPNGVSETSRFRQTGAEGLSLLKEVEQLASSGHMSSPVPRRQRGKAAEPGDSENPLQHAASDSQFTKRFLRRRYRELLSRIPILTPDTEGKYGGQTSLSPLSLSNSSRMWRVGQASEEDVDWVIKAGTVKPETNRK